VRLLLSIPSLERGGAERQFAALASGLAARGHDVLAVTLGRGGPLAASLGGARLVELGKASRLDNFRVALALAGLLRRETPAAHYAFLPSCCVLGGLLTALVPAVPLVMGVRATAVAGLTPSARLLLGLEAKLSRRAALVIANSQAGQRHCLERGFAASRLRVVPNGIDTGRFRPDRELGLALRREWGVADGERLIGLPARLDPMKDQATFLAAAALLAVRRPDVRFVCVGGGPEGDARTLRERAAALGLGGRLVWAGQRADMPAVYNALDLACLSSACGEGFPNVLGEAMACGVPCAATDVGDAALVLGDAGGLARPGDAAGLAEALARLLERLEREGAGLAATCRERVVREFSVPRMVEATEALLRTV
jgi:glycosyltransferase involved in cell wall biosynthesis